MRLGIYSQTQACQRSSCGQLCQRRTALVAILAPFASHGAQAAPPVKGSLQDQIDQCKAGDVLILRGRYEEQVVISKPITLSANPDDPATLQWQTSQPYQSTITIMAGGQLRLNNIIIRHSSPSVANNYGLFVRGGSAELSGCDISSSTGSGIGMEGGTATLSSSRIHDCQGNGAVVAGSIDLSDGMDAAEDGTAARSEARFVDCELSANGGSGLIALDGSSVELKRCTVSKNKKNGLELRTCNGTCPIHLQPALSTLCCNTFLQQHQHVQDCEASLDGCVVTQNRQASILQKRSTTVRLLQSSGKNVVQPKPELYR